MAWRPAPASGGTGLVWVDWLPLDALRPRSDAGPWGRGGRAARMRSRGPASDSRDRLGAGAALMGKGAGCGTHDSQGLRGRARNADPPRGSRRSRRPPGSRARPFGRLPLREERFSLTGRPSGEQGSIRRVCRVRDGPSRFCGMNLAKPETVIECRRTVVLLSSAVVATVARRRACTRAAGSASRAPGGASGAHPGATPRCGAAGCAVRARPRGRSMAAASAHARR